MWKRGDFSFEVCRYMYILVQVPGYGVGLSV
jgi:hypothetical protein